MRDRLRRWVAPPGMRERIESGMTGIRLFARHGRGLMGLLLGVWMLGGCGLVKKRVEPVRVTNPRLGSMTIAVAPALNLSGAADFDANRFADLMASELNYADGISVIPVSRVLAVLGMQGRVGVESPTHALELAALLGADAMLVFSVTEYDPYDPPSIGLSAQLYGTRPGTRVRGVDPVALSHRARPGPPPSQNGRRRVLAQVQRVFNASHGSLVEDIRAFARLRRGGRSPYGWRKYVVGQQLFIRYCCQATIRALLAGMGKSEFAAANRDG